MLLAGKEPQGAMICHSPEAMRSSRTHFTVYQRRELEKIFRQGGSLKLTFERFSIPREDFSITLIET